MTWLAHTLLKLMGWRFTGTLPDLPKLIIIGAPHTTNWDFIIFLAALHHYRMKASFIGKHTLFRWPFGHFFRWVGGIPVDRSAPRGLVQQVVDAIVSADRMILVMAPEGTRKPAPHWKSGFLQIAAKANIPIVLGYVDFPNRRAGLGPLVSLDGDATKFMNQARSFYADKEGRRPEGKGPVRVRAEGKPD
ncbi:MAG: lysophospholipid acyltransferase family protein [Actinomycetota bacterium]|nr:lysophospholipid acyltransferase family protein [Actinomycetota bacterium]